MRMSCLEKSLSDPIIPCLAQSLSEQLPRVSSCRVFEAAASASKIAGSASPAPSSRTTPRRVEAVLVPVEDKGTSTSRGDHCAHHTRQNYSLHCLGPILG